MAKSKHKHQSGSGKIVRKRVEPTIDESGHEHAPLPPSASSRWIACAPSMAYVRMLIEAGHIKRRVSGEAAKRGTRVHAWGEQFIKWMVKGKSTTGVKHNGKDMLREQEEAREYAEFCKDLIDQAHIITNAEDIRYGVEDRAIVDDEFCYGSRDFWIYFAGWLIVLDLKSGREPVVVKGNTQLLIYAVDKFTELSPEYVELLIWQPNSDEGGDPAKSFVYTASEMSEHSQKINGYVEKARVWFGRRSYKDLEDALVAGPHCGWCDALGVCPKARKYNREISKGAFDVIGESKTKKRSHR